MSKRIEVREILNLAEYEKVRDVHRAAVIAAKRKRRVELGPNLSLVFENRATVLFQIQEMVRTERIVDESKIQDEIDAYAGLLPSADELSATLFIEIPGIAEMSHEKAREAVNYFQGFDEGGIVLHAGAETSQARFESGFSTDEKMAAVQYLRFAVSPAFRKALEAPGARPRLTADNSRYRAEAMLPEGAAGELLRDLEA